MRLYGPSSILLGPLLGGQRLLLMHCDTRCSIGRNNRSFHQHRLWWCFAHLFLTRRIWIWEKRFRIVINFIQEVFLWLSVPHNHLFYWAPCRMHSVGGFWWIRSYRKHPSRASHDCVILHGVIKQHQPTRHTKEHPGTSENSKSSPKTWL